jgi:Undecaprenyl-phosphate glucose phosphotransferase
MNALSRITPLHEVGAPASLRETPRRSERKWPVRYALVEPIAIMADIVIILLASVLSDLVVAIGDAPLNLGKAAGLTILVASLFVCILKMQGLYQPAELLARRQQIAAVARTWILVLLLLATASAALGIIRETPRGAWLFAFVGLSMLIALRIVGQKVLWTGMRGRKFAGRNIVLVTDSHASGTGVEPSLADLGCTVVDRFMLPPAGAAFGRRKQFSARVIERVAGSEVDELFIAAEVGRWPDLRSFVGDLRVLPTPIAFVPVGAAAEILRRPSRGSGASYCIDLQRGPLTLAQRAAKRMLDLVVASAALLLLSPLLAAVAVAIKLDSRGPVFFRQRRRGFNGRTFAITKFRTMSVLEDGPTIVQARRGDRRVTRVGRWLRRASIDELPQLLNVLNGEMSLIGPRPHALAHDEMFDKNVRNYAFRRRVKPGLSGWAQIHGRRGEILSTDAIEQRVEYDLWYIDNWSLQLDFSILLLTPIEILRARNAF